MVIGGDIEAPLPHLLAAGPHKRLRFLFENEKHVTAPMALHNVAKRGQLSSMSLCLQPSIVVHVVPIVSR